MLEDQRFSMSQLRDELRETTNEAERLARVLASLEMLYLPITKPRAVQPAEVPIAKPHRS